MYRYIGKVNFTPNDLVHSGIKGMKLGIRRYQNDDGTLTEAGKKRYQVLTALNRKGTFTGKKGALHGGAASALLSLVKSAKAGRGLKSAALGAAVDGAVGAAVSGLIGMRTNKDLKRQEYDLSKEGRIHQLNADNEKSKKKAQKYDSKYNKTGLDKYAYLRDEQNKRVRDNDNMINLINRNDTYSEYRSKDQIGLNKNKKNKR